MNIFLNGYFYRNLGDDLFFHMVTGRYPQHRFYAMIHGDHAQAYKGASNVKILPQSKLMRGLEKLLFRFSPAMSLYACRGKKSDASILVGGSMFQELASDGSDLIRLAQMPQNYNKLFIMGINFGPCKTDAYQQAVKTYLSTATDVCFRDSTSYGLFHDLPNTRLGSDIVFGVESLCPKAEIRENTCVISVMDFGEKPALTPYKDAYLAFLKAQVLQQQSLGRQVILVSFSQSEGDEKGIADLLSLLPDDSRSRTDTLLYDGNNWRQICHCISAASCLIASRFHSVVLGLCYGIPTVAISYSNKTYQLLQDLNLAESAILPEQLVSCTDAPVIEPVDVTALKEAAATHFAALDQFLNKEG